MARNTSIEIGDHLGSFVDAQVNAGRYGSASEVIRTALRLLEEHEIQLAILREALIAGEQSGPAEPFEVDGFIAEQRATLDV